MFHTFFGILHLRTGTCFILLASVRRALSRRIFFSVYVLDFCPVALGQGRSIIRQLLVCVDGIFSFPSLQRDFGALVKAVLSAYLLFSFF